MEDVEAAALSLRRHWGIGLGPISNVVALGENHGAVVVRLDMDSEKLDAFSRWNDLDNKPYVILGTNKGAAARSRFTPSSRWQP